MEFGTSLLALADEALESERTAACPQGSPLSRRRMLRPPDVSVQDQLIVAPRGGTILRSRTQVS
jgi:hypothetical protein